MSKEPVKLLDQQENNTVSQFRYLDVPPPKYLPNKSFGNQRPQIDNPVNYSNNSILPKQKYLQPKAPILDFQERPEFLSSNPQFQPDNVLQQQQHQQYLLNQSHNNPSNTNIPSIPQHLRSNPPRYILENGQQQPIPQQQQQQQYPYDSKHSTSLFKSQMLTSTQDKFYQQRPSKYENGGAYQQNQSVLPVKPFPPLHNMETNTRLVAQQQQHPQQQIFTQSQTQWRAQPMVISQQQQNQQFQNQNQNQVQDVEYDLQNMRIQQQQYPVPPGGFQQLPANPRVLQQFEQLKSDIKEGVAQGPRHQKSISNTNALEAQFAKKQQVFRDYGVTPIQNNSNNLQQQYSFQGNQQQQAFYALPQAAPERPVLQENNVKSSKQQFQEGVYGERQDVQLEKNYPAKLYSSQVLQTTYDRPAISQEPRTYINRVYYNDPRYPGENSQQQRVPEASEVEPSHQLPQTKYLQEQQSVFSATGQSFRQGQPIEKYPQPQFQQQEQQQITANFQEDPLQQQQQLQQKYEQLAAQQQVNQGINESQERMEQFDKRTYFTSSNSGFYKPNNNNFQQQQQPTMKVQESQFQPQFQLNQFPTRLEQQQSQPFQQYQQQQQNTRSRFDPLDYQAHRNSQARPYNQERLERVNQQDEYQKIKSLNNTQQFQGPHIAQGGPAAGHNQGSRIGESTQIEPYDIQQERMRKSQGPEQARFSGMKYYEEKPNNKYENSYEPKAMQQLGGQLNNNYMDISDIKGPMKYF